MGFLGKQSIFLRHMFTKPSSPEGLVVLLMIEGSCCQENMLHPSTQNYNESFIL